MSAFVRTLAVLLPVVMLWGCSGTGSKDTGTGQGDQSTGQQEQSSTDTGTGAEAHGINQGSQVTGSAMTGTQMSPEEAKMKSLLAKRTVYFDFDRAEIKPEAREIIEAHAKQLAANPNMRVVLEGHCDERGTREYNLGLGERRARAVQRVMSLMGVSNRQLELVSYGEERPAAMGHDESAWSLNRRVEFVYQ